jgi:pimeloyl-ACP methyl ester carboxylesterase
MASDHLKDAPPGGFVSSKPRPSLAPEHDPNYEMEYDIKTQFGPQRVIVQGDIRLPALFTYHDIGLNSVSCFQAFFNYPEIQAIKKHFCVFHINALGQQDGARTLPDGLGHVDIPTGPDYVYPNMDQLASMILPILDQFKIRSFVGFGVGAGANVLSRFALFYPDKVGGLILVNCNCEKCGWIEWGYQKWNAWYLKSGQMTAGVEEYLLWHWFGYKTKEDNQDLVQVFTDYMRSINPTNLGHFVASYIQRSDMGIVREIDPSKKFGVKNFKCSVMLLSGTSSAHLDDVVEMNGRLDPSNSTWMKFDCGGMLLEEAPEKVSEAIRLFLQGLGYVPSLRRPSEQHPGPAHTPKPIKETA